MTVTIIVAVVLVLGVLALRNTIRKIRSSPWQGHCHVCGGWGEINGQSCNVCHGLRTR